MTFGPGSSRRGKKGPIIATQDKKKTSLSGLHQTAAFTMMAPTLCLLQSQAKRPRMCLGGGRLLRSMEVLRVVH